MDGRRGVPPLGHVPGGLRRLGRVGRDQPRLQLRHHRQEERLQVGTITIDTSGVFTFATTGGATVSFISGDTIDFYAPDSVGTAANFKITLVGSL